MDFNNPLFDLKDESSEKDKKMEAPEIESSLSQIVENQDDLLVSIAIDAQTAMGKEEAPVDKQEDPTDKQEVPIEKEEVSTDKDESNKIANLMDKQLELQQKVNEMLKKEDDFDTPADESKFEMVEKPKEQD